MTPHLNRRRRCIGMQPNELKAHFGCGEIVRPVSLVHLIIWGERDCRRMKISKVRSAFRSLVPFKSQHIPKHQSTFPTSVRELFWLC